MNGLRGNLQQHLVLSLKPTSTWSQVREIVENYNCSTFVPNPTTDHVSLIGQQEEEGAKYVKGRKKGKGGDNYKGKGKNKGKGDYNSRKRKRRRIQQGRKRIQLLAFLVEHLELELLKQLQLQQQRNRTR